MIFYQGKDDKVNYGWIPCWELNPSYEDFKKCRFKIGGTVFNERTDEFLKAVRADKMWDRLMYREQQ